MIVLTMTMTMMMLIMDMKNHDDNCDDVYCDERDDGIDGEQHHDNCNFCKAMTSAV